MLRILLIMTCFFFTVNGDEIKSSEIAKYDIKKAVEKMTPLKGLTPAQWRVIWTGDASTQAIVSWSTEGEGKKHVVHYGEEARGGETAKYTFHQVSQRSGAYSVQQPKKSKNDSEKKSNKAPEQGAFYHHARLKNLKPSTRYYFVIESDGNMSRQFYFRTAPVKGTNFSIIHGGDSRSGHANRCRMNLRIAHLVKENSEILGFAHGGDYIVSGKSWGQWRLWLSNHELTTLDDGRVIPVIPTRGNHDSGPLYKEIFDIDSKAPDWHTTTIGDDVALVTLDTNVSAGGKQSEWLEKQLTEYRPKVTWLLTQYHRPLFPAVKQPARHAKEFVPLFEKYNVDLALESDGHCIKRTVPIRAGKADSTGVVYVGEGGLGVGQRTPKKDLWYLKDGMTGQQHHVMQLDITDETLRIRTILLDGKIFDDHTFKVRK